MAVTEVATVLPPLYARWIDSLLASPIPHETRATCDECAMCAPEGTRPQDGTQYFSPRTKCCTYQPSLPNYLVGRVLEDRDFAFSAGRATLEKRVQAGVEVSPLGVGASRIYRMLYDQGRGGFGRSESMRCPHYLEEAGGRCGVWRHRSAICSTWFCKFERGSVGMVFWDRTRNLLLAIERSLSVWCVLEAGLEPEALGANFPLAGPSFKPESLTPLELDGAADPETAQKLWGAWLGREREFYGLCARRVESLTWADVERIGGAEVSALAHLASRAFQALITDELPERLALGEFRVMGASRDAVRVETYTGSDPLDLDPAVIQVLPYFDGRPVTEALAAIEKEQGVRVERDLLRRLADFEVLVPAPAPARTSG